MTAYRDGMDEIDETVTEATVEPEAAPSDPTSGGLHRSSTKRLIGGVAGGIGERFDIDANIVRVGFVVLSVVYGLGVAIYLAMWALIPLAKDSAVSVEAKPARRVTTRWIRYALLAGVAVLVVIAIAIESGRPQYGRAFGILWVVFLAVLAVITLRVPARAMNFGRFVALSFLVALSFFIVVAGVFAAVLASTGVPVTGGNGVRAWQPTSLSQVQRTYRSGFGTSTLDLAHVTFPKGGITVTASVGVGYLLIELPANAVVDLKTHVGIGAINYPYREGWSTAPFTPVPTGLRTSASQAAAPHLVLNASVGFGIIGLVRAKDSGNASVSAPTVPRPAASSPSVLKPSVPTVP